ncbi:MAG: DNA-3-methyladenine glycosylase [bacterium]|nr:DNA-3-methyladenine glycosylase [bacterium]
MIFKRDFYRQNAVIVARKLLGSYLVHQSPEGKTVGRIVETEAYLGKDDPASHAYRGKTRRNAVMFGPPGHAYIYFTYGMHYCFNVVTGKNGVGEAALIRALEPLEGLELIKQRRKTVNVYQLCSGPAKLVQAMGITPDLNGSDLTSGPLQIFTAGIDNEKIEIITAPRIGISQAQDLPLRFYIKGNSYISH